MALAASALLVGAFIAPALAQTPIDSAERVVALGMEAYRGGTREQLEQAIRLWQQAVPLLRRAGVASAEATVLNAIGRVHHQLGRRDSALAYMRMALPIMRAAGDSAGEAMALGNIGALHRDLGRPDSALAYYARALPIERARGDRPGEAKTLTNIGAVHRGVGRPDSALAYYAWALSIQRAVGDRDGEATTLNNIGLAHDNLGRPDSALAYYGEALPIVRAVGNRAGEGTTLNNIGVVYLGVGRPDSALSYFARALPIRRAVGDRSGEASTLNNIGRVYENVGRPDSALHYFRQALPIQRDVGDRSGEATALNNIGSVHRGLSRPDSALAYFALALPIQRMIGDRVAEASTLINIGEVHEKLGRPDSALVYYARAIPIMRAAGNRVGEATALSNIGLVLGQVGQPDSALAYHARAAPIMRATGNRAGEAAILGNIGRGYQRLGYADSALAYLTQALPVHRAVGARASEAATLGNIGAVYSGIGRRDSALVYHGQALSIVRAVGNRDGEATVLGNIGHTYHYGSPPRLRIAIAYYDSAAAALASVADRAGTDQNRLSFAEQQVGYFETWALAWLSLATEVGVAHSARAALAAAERGRAQALLSLMRQTAARAAGTVGATAAATRAGDNLEEAGRRMAAVTSSSGGALVYLVTPDTLLTWLITPGAEVTVFRSGVSAGEIAAQVAVLRAGLAADSAAARSHTALRATPDLDPVVRGVAGIGQGRVAERHAAAARLSSWLIPPALTERLPAASELVIVPHGPLNLLPFAALSIDSTAAPLGIRYSLRYAPSLATLAALAASRGRTAAEARASAVVVGNPVMPRVRSAAGAEITLGPLAGAEAEARWVSDQIGAPALRGAAATEAEIKRRLPSASLVHLATHGFAYSSDARARDSFIALAPSAGEDGLLTVGEVLDALPSLEAELVVLSACQTGLGDLKQAEGTVGLQRAFLAKGARSVLVSLWSVSDEATERLMRSFYTHWLNGASKAEALRRAQVEVRAEAGSRFHDPRYWAAFQLVGTSR